MATQLLPRSLPPADTSCHSLKASYCTAQITLKRKRKKDKLREKSSGPSNVSQMAVPICTVKEAPVSGSSAPKILDSSGVPRSTLRKSTYILCHVAMATC